MITCIMTKNYVLKPIYNDENECINDTLSITNSNDWFYEDETLIFASLGTSILL